MKRADTGVSPSHPQYLLNLTAGYLDAAVAVTVYYSNNGLPIMSPSDSHAVAYEANQVAIDFIKGRVTLNAAVPGAHFRTVAVAYTHGFETDEEGEGSYYIGVPDVLKWGCCVEAARIIASHPGRVTDKIPFKEIQSEYQRSAHRQLRNLIRQRIAGDDPQYTETV